jgi:hypothetical protein
VSYIIFHSKPLIGDQIAVTELKERLAPVASVAPDRQRLIFRGKVLTDTSRVTDFSIEDGDTVHLIIRKDDAPPTAAAPPAAEVPAPVNPPVSAPIDLNSIMNNVMSSLGIAGNSGNVSVNVTTGTVGPDGRIHMHNAVNSPAMPAMNMAAPMGHIGHMGPQALPLPAAPMMPCDNVRETLNQVNTDLAAVLHANSLPCDSAPALAGPVATDVAGIVAVAQQTLTSTARIQTALQFLMSRISEEPNMNVPAERAALEEVHLFHLIDCQFISSSHSMRPHSSTLPWALKCVVWAPCTVKSDVVSACCRAARRPVSL